MEAPQDLPGKATLRGGARRPRRRLPLVLNSPHSGACYPAAFLAASRLDATAIRRSEDTYVDELIADAAAARRAAAQGQFPARLARREPRALRARPEDVRRRAADLRQHPLRPGRRRSRHDRPHRLGERGDLRRPAPGRGGAGPHRQRSTSPITARCANWSSTPAPPSAWRSWSIATPCPRPCAACTGARAPTSCSATATGRAARSN